MQCARGQLRHRETKTPGSEATLPLPDISVTALKPVSVSGALRWTTRTSRRSAQIVVMTPNPEVLSYPRSSARVAVTNIRGQYSQTAEGCCTSVLYEARNKIIAGEFRLVGDTGIEPVTSSV